MKKLLISIVAICIFSSSAQAAMTISSTDFKEGAMVPERNIANIDGCRGKNTFPQIDIKNAPHATKSFAITLYDPDAPTGSGLWHWVVYNIPGSIKSSLNGNAKINNIADLGRGTIYGRNDLGTYGYDGPCPPVGSAKHRYILTVYALNIPQLLVKRESSAAIIGYNINASVIEKASITAVYQR